MLHRPSWKRLVAVLCFAQSTNRHHNHGRPITSLEQLLVAGRADRAGISAVQSSAILAAGRLLCSAVFEFAQGLEQFAHDYEHHCEIARSRGLQPISSK